MKEKQTPIFSSLTFLIFAFSPIFKYKKIQSLFSGTERPTKLKLGPHRDTRLRYHVYLNQAAGANLFLYISSIFFLSNSKTLFFFSHFSVRPTKLELDTHMDNAEWVDLLCTPNAASTYLFLYFLFLLAEIKNLHLQICFNIPLMAIDGGM